MNLSLPSANAILIDGNGRPTREYYTFYRSLVSNLQAVSVPAPSTPGDGPYVPISATVRGIGSLQFFGTLADGLVSLSLFNDVDTPGNTNYYGSDGTGQKGWYAVSDTLAVSDNLTKTVGDDGVSTFDLADLADSGQGTLLAVTRDGKGRVSGTKEATITGTAGRVSVANGDAAAGLPTIDLATLADTGGSSLLKISRDAYGRVAGTSAATTDDLAEGESRLYFTPARAQDAAGAALADTDDIDLAYDPAARKIAASLTETGVAAGVYGDSTHVPQITVDANGRVTSVELVPISGGGGDTSYRITPNGNRRVTTAGDNRIWS